MSNSTRTMFACLALLSLPAAADDERKQFVSTRLVSYQEVPAISSAASGQFRALIDDREGTISYTLSYQGLSSEVR